MASRKKNTSNLSSVPNNVTNIDDFLTIDEFLSGGETLPVIELPMATKNGRPGRVHHHHLSLELGIQLMELQTQMTQEGKSESEGQLAATKKVAQILANDVLCNADGSQFITEEQLRKAPLTMLTYIMGQVTSQNPAVKNE